MSEVNITNISGDSKWELFISLIRGEWLSENKVCSLSGRVINNFKHKNTIFGHVIEFIHEPFYCMIEVDANKMITRLYTRRTDYDGEKEYDSDLNDSPDLFINHYYGKCLRLK